MLIRTVLDAREGVSKKYIWQVCLLAASWRQYMSDKSALEVLVIGRLQKNVEKFLKSIGVGLIPTGPHANEKFSRTSNKLLGTSVNIKNGPLLLLDNDTCFVGDAAIFAAPPPGTEVMASVASNVRVSDAQWEYIEKQLGLKPLEFEWLSLKEELKALQTGVRPISRSNRLYANSGVVWMRHPVEFGGLWGLHIRQIAELFESHPLKDRNVRRSDQAGMATAIGVCGNFSILPVEYNYRSHCFLLGKSMPDDIKIIHMTNMNMPEIDSITTIEQLIRLFWERRIFQQISDFPARERESLMIGSDEILRRVCSLIVEYDLNKVGLLKNADSGFFNSFRFFIKK